MADDFDVDSMLEAPYKKEDEVERGGHHEDRDRSEKRSKDKKRSKRSRSRDKDRRDRDRDSKRRERDRDREANGTRDKERHKRERERRSRSRERKSRSPRERRSRSREKKSPPREHHHERKRSRERRRERRYSISPIRRAEPELTPEERDARTVFVMQLSARIRPRDLEEFFSSVGKVRDVRIITDNKTRRSKGIAYIEFGETESVPLAMGLQGQRLLGVPIIVQASQAEKNRIGQAGAVVQKGMSGPMRLYVGSLHFNITEDMLRGIFEPFGKIDQINLMMDSSTGRSKGFGFITFHNAEDAKKALEQLNGFELAGRPMKVGHVTERTADTQGSSALDSDEMDRAGIDLGATGRLQLMAKLAEGTGFQIPNAAANALNMSSGSQPPPPATTGQNGMQQQSSQSTPPIATQCFLLSNMFDPASETSATWDVEIRDDVIEQCNKHGGVLHIYVDKASPQGNVYVKCPSIAAAVASVNSLHGRWFAGKVITAAYVPLPNYHSLFPDAQRATQLVMSTQQTIALGLAPGMAAPTAANFH